MDLNGQTQYLDHLTGKKHKKNLKRRPNWQDVAVAKEKEIYEEGGGNGEEGDGEESRKGKEREGG
jgi:hypothetical protein